MILRSFLFLINYQDYGVFGMDVSIRPVIIQNAHAINEIRSMDGVRENTMGIIGDRVKRTEERLNSLNENDHYLVAEIKEQHKKHSGIYCTIS